MFRGWLYLKTQCISLSQTVSQIGYLRNEQAEIIFEKMCLRELIGITKSPCDKKGQNLEVSSQNLS